MQTWSTITEEALDVECNLKMIYSLIRNILSNMQLHLFESEICMQNHMKTITW